MQNNIDNSLRNAIGGLRSATGERLNQQQINSRLLRRIEELEQAQFRLMGALQCLGADACDRCGLWFEQSKVVCAGDRCRCFNCFDSFDDFYEEDDDDEAVAQITAELMKVAFDPKWASKVPTDKQGNWVEPWRTERMRRT